MKQNCILLKLILTIFISLTFATKTVHAEDALARIGDTEYASLQEAIDAAENNEKPTLIEIIRDGDTDGGINIDSKNPKNVIIEFNGKSVTFSGNLVGSSGYVSQNVNIGAGSKVVFQNGTLKASDNSKMMIQNYADLTLTDMIIDARDGASNLINGATSYYAISNNNGSLLLNGNTTIYTSQHVANPFAFDVYYKLDYPKGVNVTIDTTGTILGDIEVSIQKNVDFEQFKSTLTIKNGTIDGKLNIKSGLEKNVTILGGAYTDTDTIESLFSKDELASFYKIEIQKDTYAYVKETLDNIQFLLAISNLEKNSSNASEINALKEIATNQNYKIATFYQVDLTKTLLYNGQTYEIEKIPEPGKPYKVTLTIPSTLEKNKEDVYRNYYILRYHNDEVSVIKAFDNGNGTVSFESDKFSSYALVYQDTDVPNTYDALSTLVIIGILALSSLIILGYIMKKEFVK